MNTKYSFLIGNEGTIFEGRGWSNQGSFYRGQNNISYGIAFMGTFGETSGNNDQITYSFYFNIFYT